MATIIVEARQEFVERTEIPSDLPINRWQNVWVYNVGSWKDQTEAQALDTFRLWSISEKEAKVTLAFARAFGFTTLEVER